MPLRGTAYQGERRRAKGGGWGRAFAFRQVTLAQPDVLVRLGEREALVLAGRRGPLADHRLQIPARTIRARAVANLAEVGLERRDLQVDRVLDVDEDVREVGAAEVDLFDLVRLEALAEQLREDERIARGGVDRVEGGVAAGPVVGVVDVALGRPAGRRVLADDDVRLEAADLADDVAAQAERVLEDAVLIVRETPDP